MRKLVSLITLVVFLLSIVTTTIAADNSNGSTTITDPIESIVVDNAQSSNKDNTVEVDPTTNSVDQSIKKNSITEEKTTPTQGKNEQKKDINRVEVTSMRTADSRFYKNSDGTMTAVFQLDNQSTIATGDSLTIDNNQSKIATGDSLTINDKSTIATGDSLTISNDAIPSYENKSKRFKAKFLKNPDKKIMGFAVEDSELGIELNQDSASAKKINVEGQVKGNTISYNELLPNTDFNYQTIGNGVKESIILKNQNSPNTFSFKINTTNLYWAEVDGGRIEFASSESGKSMYYIKPVYAKDADGKALTTVRQTATPVQNGLTLDITIDKQELATAKFPVTIDPTITIPSGSDQMIVTCVYYDNYSGYLNNTELVKYNLSSIPRGSTINSTILDCGPVYSDGTGDLGSGGGASYSINVLNQEWLSDEVTVSKLQGMVGEPISDLTSLVQRWVNGTLPNNGIVVCGSGSLSLSITYVPDTTPPTVTIASPAANASLSGTIPISVNVQDNSGIQRVEIYAGQALLATKTAAPYTINWDTTTFANGSYNIWSRAYDLAGNSSVSANTAITVNNPVSVLAPGTLTAAVASDGKINLSWGASSTPGAVYRVYRSITPGVTATDDKLVAGGFNNNSYTDSNNLVNGTTYNYRVASVDKTGMIVSGTLSNEVSVVSAASTQTISATFARSSVAYKQDGTQVATGAPRYETGKYGQGVMFEEGTTNLLTANQSSVETDTTGFTNNPPLGNPGATISRITSDFWQGTACLQVTTTSANAYEGFGTTGISGLANTTYTGSMWFKATNGQVLQAVLWDSTNSVVLSASSITGNGAWQRIVLTGTIGSSPSSSMFLTIRTTTAVAVTFYVDGLQIEQKTYATSWQIGGISRVAETLTIPTAAVLNANEGTISFWLYRNPANNSYQNPFSILVPGGNNNRLSLERMGSSNNFYLWIADNASIFNTVSSPSITLLENTLYNIALTWKAGVYYLYLNGQLVSGYPITADHYPSSFSASEIDIGYACNWPGREINGIIDDLCISNRVRTISEIQAAYNSNQPLPGDDATTCKMSFDGNLNISNTQASSDATFTRSSVAYKQDGTQVASGAPRYETGKYGQGVMLEEGTTNLLTANQSSVETDTTGFTNNPPLGNPGATISRITSDFWQGTACLQVTTTSANAYEGFGTTGISGLANTTYTGSMWFKATNGQVLQAVLWDSTNSVVLSASNITGNGAWQRIVLTGTIGSSPSSSMFLTIRTTTAVAVTFYVDGLQIEQKTYATSWQIGGISRVAETLTIPTAAVLNANEGTISFWLYRNSANNSYQNPFSILVPGGNNNRLSLERAGSSNNFYLWIADNASIFNTVSSPSITLLENTLYNIALTWKAGVYYLYLNGQLVSGYPITADHYPSSFSASEIDIGYACNWPGREINGIIDDLYISNRVRTISEIQASYTSGQPLPVDDATTCKMSFDGNLSITGSRNANQGGSSTDTSSRIGIKSFWNYASLPLANGEAMVNTGSGNLAAVFTDSLLPGNHLATEIRRTYNSLDKTSGGAFGPGWSANILASLTINTDNSVTYNMGDGYKAQFTYNGGTYTAPTGIYLTLVKNTDGSYTIKRKDNISLNFDASGKLITIKDLNNNTITYNYTGTQLTSITDTVGRTLTITYDSNGRIHSLTDPRTNPTIYTYDPTTGDLATVTDPMGYVTSYYYDANHNLNKVLSPDKIINYLDYDTSGHLLKIKDGLGDTTNLTWDFTGGISTITDPRGKITTFHFNPAFGNCSSVTDALGQQASITCDANYNPLTITDPGGHTTTYTYDNWGNMLTNTDALNHTTTVTYNNLNQPLTVTDVNAGITHYQYDTNGNLTQTTDPLSHATAYVNDNHGRRTLATDANGGIITYHYDDSAGKYGVLDYITNAENKSSYYTYDNMANIKTSKDPNNNITTYTYDALGRLIRTDYPNGAVAFAFIDGDGLIRSETNANGGSTSYAYDAAGRVTKITDPMGYITTAQYDGAGNQIAVTDPTNITTNYTYDDLNRPKTSINPLGNTTTYNYDACGNMTEIIDPMGHIAFQSYDALQRVTASGRRTTSGGANVNATTYTYDNRGNVLTSTDPLGHTTNYQYNPDNQLTSVTNLVTLDPTTPAVQTQINTQYGYDNCGNRITVTNANGHITGYTYDKVGHVKSETLPGNFTTSYTYDPDGRVISKTDPKGQTITYTYNPTGNLLSKTYPDNSTVSYTYDSLGKRLTMKDTLTTSYYTYDANARLTGTMDDYGNTLNYSYDNAGRKLSMTTSFGTQTCHYNGAGQLDKLTDFKNNIINLAYDLDGKITQITYPNAGNIVDTYNNLDQLTNRSCTASNGNYYHFDYQYDNNGNIDQCIYNFYATDVSPSTQSSTGVYQYNEINQITSENVSSTPYGGNNNLKYCYDKLGNRTKKYINDYLINTYQYDANTELLMNEQYTPQVMNINLEGYSKTNQYDSNGNQIKVVNQSSRPYKGPSTTTNKYDYENSLIYSNLKDDYACRKYVENHIVNGDGQLLGVQTGVTETLTNQIINSYGTYSQYDGSQVIADRDGAGATISSYNRLPNGRLLSSYITITRDNKTRDTVYSFADILNTSVADVRPNHAYTNMFGLPSFGDYNVAQSDTRFSFTGAPYFSGIGLYQMGARFYNPSTGRFITRDTYRGNIYQPWTQNLYTYCNNNPINYVDPSGHNAASITTTIWNAAKGTAAGAAEGTTYGSRAGFWGAVAGAVIGSIFGHPESVVDQATEDELQRQYQAQQATSSDRSLPLTGNPNSTVDRLDKDGNVVQRRQYDGEGRASKDTDYSDHGTPNIHENPHDHTWDWSDPENPVRN